MEKQAEYKPKTIVPDQTGIRTTARTAPVTSKKAIQGLHDPLVLNDTERRIVAILGNRLGKSNAIRMNKLADMVGIKPRGLRLMINHLKFDHRIPIMSWDDWKQGGYYIPTDLSDQYACTQMFMARIWTSLKNVATVKGISLIEAGELFAIELTEMVEDEAKKEFMSGLPKPPEGYSLITALARHVQNNPEKYQQDLHLLQNIFGAKFIKRERLRELTTLRQQLNSLCSDLEE